MQQINFVLFMNLTTDQLTEILKTNPNKTMLDKARSDSKKYKAHVMGIGNDYLLSKVTGLENEEQLKLRKKYARSNKDLFSRIHRPDDKVYSAKGGSYHYDINENLKRDLIARLQNIVQGFSVKEWVEQIARQYYRVDPMGLIFMEVGSDVTYPTYKSTSTIFDYQLNGRDVEYVIFYDGKDNEKDEKIYRVVDSSRDYRIKVSNDFSIQTLDDFTNWFGHVPAKIISDIIGNDTNCYTSPDHEIVELADEYLRECSVKSIYKLMHGFPKSWQYLGVCKPCGGTGFIESAACPSCKGSGKSIYKDASEVIGVPIPQSGDPVLSEIGGYLSPDIEGWSKMTDEQTLLENLMHSTYWGIKDRVKAQGIGDEKTATEIIDDMQPIHDRLYKSSTWAEGIDKFITDHVAEYHYNIIYSGGRIIKKSVYKGCSVSYGRRYMIEGPDAIWKKYEAARKSGSPQSVLDEHLLEYYYSKYSTNTTELAKYIKLMKVEPFLHTTVSEAKNIITDFNEYNRKVYFSEWLSQLPDNEVLLKDAAALRLSLDEYVKAKNLKEPEPKEVIK